MTAPLDTSIHLPIGTRVKYSAEGLRAFRAKKNPPMPERRGIVVAVRDTCSCRVINWDSMATKTPLHIDFLEVAE